MLFWWFLLLFLILLVITIIMSKSKYVYPNYSNSLSSRSDPEKDLEEWEENSKNRKKLDDEISKILKFVYNKDYVPIETKFFNFEYIEMIREMYQKGLKKEEHHSEIVTDIMSFFLYHDYEDIDDIDFESLMMSMTELPIDGNNDSDWEKIYDEEMNEESNYKRHTISQSVKDKVWNRDNGKCVECGSNEKLEFDHIIPVSKGGSNTYRNIQLLCEPCNRSKSDKIG